MKRPLVIAHRGASGDAPENTLAAYKKALDFGADGIEIDIHLSKDGRLIVCHDEKVDRTTDGKGLINDMTLREIKRLDAGSWYGEAYRGEKILVLEEVLDLLREKDILLNIELKNGIIPYRQLEEKVLQRIKDYRMKEKIIISSFNHTSLMKIKQLNQSIKTGVLYVAALVEPWEYAKKIKADALHPLFYNIRPELVRNCRQSSIDINTFVVNEAIELSLISKLGVSGIITNYPDRARRIIG
ncbi:glycerophosphoryl diester phosphodiesterase [Anaerosolibacter carboniphilus]|uniref:Glycerophosphoryl diester phosphodiesterase n=1 Tax=Anaerosolibacter carboniphilus TaxID=1417629 RepID=A0A841KPR9_9FIRM|nr:glycerophosphodiester phosphodiesterase [Anaerosolibacter carboniphilus]MBB6215423.1 glycerophosphoryl diester phosphodiesterase [Anaerosolibacter carboniphilus]